MATKQFLFFCNREDFIEVADLILTNNTENDIKAISRLAHWKCSLPEVPAAVLCTHTLLVIRSFHTLEKPNSKDHEALAIETSPASYIGEEFRTLAYASAVSRSISLLLEDNDDWLCQGLSMKALASALGLPDWLTDVRNEIAHGKRMLSVEFLSFVVERILYWLRENFWKFLLDKYSAFVVSGANGSPFWLQLEDLLVAYEQHTYKAISLAPAGLRVIPTRRRVLIVRQLGSMARANLQDFCCCFVRVGYMFPTFEQLSFLGVEQRLINFWKRSKRQSLTSSHLTLNKRMNSAFIKTRKFWRMLIFHLSNSIPDAIPALIESIIQTYPTSPSLFDRQIRHNCWLNYLIDKYVSKKPVLGVEVMKRCSLSPAAISLAVLRRLSFIDWPTKIESVKCNNLIELMSTYLEDSDEQQKTRATNDPFASSSNSNNNGPFTKEDAEDFLKDHKN